MIDDSKIIRKWKVVVITSSDEEYEINDYEDLYTTVRDKFYVIVDKIKQDREELFQSLLTKTI